MSKILDDFFEYLKSKDISHSTFMAYRSDLLLIEKDLKKELINATSDDILSILQTNESTSTINRKISSINKFFDFCKNKYSLDNDISIKQVKIPKNLPQFLSYDEIKDGIAKIETKNWQSLRDKAFILFLYATGTKVSEALDVKIIDIQDYLVKIKNSKNKERLVPIPKQLIKLLNQYLNKREIDSGYLWINQKGDKLSRISAFKITKKYLDVSPHVLRHSFASSMILNGADLQFVSELLGYSSISSSQVYTNFSQSDVLNALKKYHPLSN